MSWVNDMSLNGNTLLSPCSIWPRSSKISQIKSKTEIDQIFQYKSNLASDWFLIAWYFCTFSMVELNLFDFPTEDSALSVTEVETSYIINWTVDSQKV